MPALYARFMNFVELQLPFQWLTVALFKFMACRLEVAVRLRFPNEDSLSENFI